MENFSVPAITLNGREPQNIFSNSRFDSQQNFIDGFELSDSHGSNESLSQLQGTSDQFDSEGDDYDGQDVQVVPPWLLPPFMPSQQADTLKKVIQQQAATVHALRGLLPNLAQANYNSPPPPVPVVQSNRSSTAGIHIPRPKNSFMTYRAERQHEVLISNPGANNKDVSKIIGAMWRTESPEVKEYYRKRAELHKHEHKLLYPDYKYQPKRLRSLSKSRPKLWPEDLPAFPSSASREFKHKTLKTIINQERALRAAEDNSASSTVSQRPLLPAPAISLSFDEQPNSLPSSGFFSLESTNTPRSSDIATSIPSLAVAASYPEPLIAEFKDPNAYYSRDSAILTSKPVELKGQQKLVVKPASFLAPGIKSANDLAVPFLRPTLASSASSSASSSHESLDRVSRSSHTSLASSGTASNQTSRQSSISSVPLAFLSISKTGHNPSDGTLPPSWSSRRFSHNPIRRSFELSTEGASNNYSNRYPGKRSRQSSASDIFAAPSHNVQAENGLFNIPPPPTTEAYGSPPHSQPLASLMLERHASTPFQLSSSDLSRLLNCPTPNYPGGRESNGNRQCDQLFSEYQTSMIKPSIPENKTQLFPAAVDYSSKPNASDANYQRLMLESAALYSQLFPSDNTVLGTVESLHGELIQGEQTNILIPHHHRGNERDARNERPIPGLKDSSPPNIYLLSRPKFQSVSPVELPYVHNAVSPGTTSNMQSWLIADTTPGDTHSGMVARADNLTSVLSSHPLVSPLPQSDFMKEAALFSPNTKELLYAALPKSPEFPAPKLFALNNHSF